MQNYYIPASSGGVKMKILQALNAVLDGKTAIFVCIGTDAVTGDSLGPLVGTMLRQKLGGRTYVFGSLDKPVTARDVNVIAEFVKRAYPYEKTVAIDAALGKREEIGGIKISDRPVKPGLGVEKDLAEIGDASIIAVVDEKTSPKASLSSVRLSLVYSLAEAISEAVKEYFDKLSMPAVNCR